MSPGSKITPGWEPPSRDENFSWISLDSAVNLLRILFHLIRERHTIVDYYVRSHICKLVYLLNSGICKSKIDTAGSFTVSLGYTCAERQKKLWVTWYICSQLRSSKVMLCLVSTLSPMLKPTTAWSVSATFSDFCASYWWFCHFKQPLSIVLCSV